jgi:hypothetical protein
VDERHILNEQGVAGVQAEERRHQGRRDGADGPMSETEVGPKIHPAFASLV